MYVYADLRLSYATVILQKKIFVVYWCWSKKWDEIGTELICWYVFSAVHIILLPSQKPPSSYSLLKFVYVTSRLRHSLVGHPLPRKILNWSTYIFSKGLWSRLATIVHLANDLSLCVKQICLPRHYFKLFKNNKIEPWKTVRLTRFQKPQLQSISIFFKFVYPCLFLYF